MSIPNQEVLEATADLLNGDPGIAIYDVSAFLAEEADPIPTLPPSPVGEIDVYRFEPKEYQRALRLLGFNPGPIDGIIGEKTRAALEDFQEKAGLKPDGWYGYETARAMKVALGTRNLLDRRYFGKE